MTTSLPDALGLQSCRVWREGHTAHLPRGLSDVDVQAIEAGAMALIADCGLFLQCEIADTATNLTDLEVRLFQEAHRLAHRLDNLVIVEWRGNTQGLERRFMNYGSKGIAWTMGVTIHEATGEILEINPIKAEVEW